MKILKLSVVTFFVVALALSTASRFAVRSQSGTEAPAGFDNLTNGFLTQATMGADRGVFEERDDIAKGLGPVYNAQSCAECHQNPVSGGISQITEFRAGHLDANGSFVAAPGGSLLNARATNAAIQERRPGTENIFTFRTSLNTPGDGFVAALRNTTPQNIAAAPPNQSARARRAPARRASTAARTATKTSTPSPPSCARPRPRRATTPSPTRPTPSPVPASSTRSEEHTSELQSRGLISYA